jgi:ribonuclease BN (tRNA processing enzyme)
MNPTRRTVLAGATAAPIAAAGRALAEPAADSGRTRLIILGTLGGPSVGAARHQTSHVIIRGQDAYVIDCGYGVTEQLVKAQAPLAGIRDIFITHHHPDHNIELGTLIYFAWYAGMDRPLGLYGPPPLKRIADDYLKAIKPDVDIWLDDIGHKPMAPVRVHEVSQAGPVMRDANLAVTAAIVNHPPVVPALAYRFDAPDRSIVFSGDTTPSESLVKLAMGADVLVHEAMMLGGPTPAGTRPPGAGGSGIQADADKLMRHLRQSHSPVEEVGRIAAEAGVKTLVLSHLAPAFNVDEDQWRARAAQHFKGRIIVARDLLEI